MKNSFISSADYATQYAVCDFVRRVRKIAESDYSFITCPSIRMEQLGFHLTDFYKIWYLSIFKTSVLKMQVSLKSDKNNWYFTWRPMYIFCHISKNSS